MRRSAGTSAGIGLGSIIAMALVVALAHGFGGQPPSKQYVDDQLAKRLAADAVMGVITDPARPDGLIVTAPTPIPRKVPSVNIDRPLVHDFRVDALHAAQEAGIRTPILFVRQMAAESGYQPCARSGAGALGIAQIMPGTARGWKVDPFNPIQSLKVAARHMARYEKQYGSYPLALAAYNAGSGAVAAAGGRVPPYAETREYIRRVMDRKAPLPGMKAIYRQPPRLTTEFASRLRRLQRAVRRRGGKLVINEGWRSYDRQMLYWKQAKKSYGGWDGARTWVAPPGCSNHNRGLAADFQQRTYGEKRGVAIAHEIAWRFGLVFPMGHEPWHVELGGIPTQSG